MSDYAKTRNMCATPYPSSKNNIWNVKSEQLDNGLWRYMVDGGGLNRGTVRAAINSTAVNVGDVLVLVYECDQPALLVGLTAGGSYCMRGCDWLCGGVTGRIGWNACEITDTSWQNHEFVIHRDAGWVTIRGAANYTHAAWPAIAKQIADRDLPTAWFAPPRDGTASIRYPPTVMP